MHLAHTFRSSIIVLVCGGALLAACSEGPADDRNGVRVKFDSLPDQTPLFALYRINMRDRTKQLLSACWQDGTMYYLDELSETPNSYQSGQLRARQLVELHDLLKTANQPSLNEVFLANPHYDEIIYSFILFWPAPRRWEWNEKYLPGYKQRLPSAADRLDFFGAWSSLRFAVTEEVSRLSSDQEETEPEPTEPWRKAWTDLKFAVDRYEERSTQ